MENKKRWYLIKFSIKSFNKKVLTGTVISFILSILLWGAIYNYSIINKETTMLNGSDQSFAIISGFLILSTGTIITIYSLIESLKD